jgi:hypothetical protein
MLSKRTNDTPADELLVAATAIERSDQGVDVETLPSELDALAEALRASGRALATSASGVVPAAEPRDHGACTRYQRAAASWPTTPPPSHEAFTGTLASLHDAADAARLAARRCDDARRTVEALLRTSHGAGSP